MSDALDAFAYEDHSNADRVDDPGFDDEWFSDPHFAPADFTEHNERVRAQIVAERYADEPDGGGHAAASRATRRPEIRPRSATLSRP